jgi:hypothetical protein
VEAESHRPSRALDLDGEVDRSRIEIEAGRGTDGSLREGAGGGYVSPVDCRIQESSNDRRNPKTCAYSRRRKSESTQSKYLGVLVAAKYTRELNALPRDLKPLGPRRS